MNYLEWTLKKFRWLHDCFIRHSSLQIYNTKMGKEHSLKNVKYFDLLTEFFEIFFEKFEIRNLSVKTILLTSMVITEGGSCSLL